MNVLVACEESQRVCEAFRKRGHNAFSCDIVDCSGGHPEWHFKQDVLQVIPNFGGKLQNGEEYYLPEGEERDLMVAHPLAPIYACPVLHGIITRKTRDYR